MTYSSAEADHKNRDAQCGLPGNKIGWSTAETVTGCVRTIWTCDWRESCESIFPGANADLRSRGIREVANVSGPTSLLETSCWRQLPVLILGYLNVSEKADIMM